MAPKDPAGCVLQIVAVPLLVLGMGMFITGIVIDGGGSTILFGLFALGLGAAIFYFGRRYQAGEVQGLPKP
ncbi:MAG: hypothetical protein CL477_17420 [Acidobacteria bacterium]|jgi:hypothetical protein|nr:hypothetical protein [Acidobacteriota bacterium]MDP7338369.1 hypothetical protein [Vicinamibacterales bacterium]HJN46107.1 hypothetical protein [Vicinamibacterales bacterium]|tara:strand:+ start:207 stop:419 length:213 start_codon:yes stop_codon:yes gene_type:complete